MMPAATRNLVFALIAALVVGDSDVAVGTHPAAAASQARRSVALEPTLQETA